MSREPRPRRRSSSSAVRGADSSRKGTRAASPSSTATRTIPRSSRPISQPCATAAGCWRCSSRTSTRGRCHLVHGFAEALAGADAVCVTEIYPAREEPLPGVTGRLIVDELARIRPGMRIGWGPSLEDAATLVAGWARPGDTVLTLGAGDVDRAGIADPRGARMKIEEGVELARFTTLGTGGPARRLRTPGVRGRGGGASRLGAGALARSRCDRPRLEPPGGGRRRRSARAEARRGSWRRSRSTVTY